MKERAINNFKKYFPVIFENTKNIKVSKFTDEVLVECKDGTMLMYDDMDHTIRRLPDDSSNLTEEECKWEFGRRLRRLMRVKGITQAELSEKTGISQYLLSGYITGKRSPSFYRVDKIAKALECSTDELRYI